MQVLGFGLLGVVFLGGLPVWVLGFAGFWGCDVECRETWEESVMVSYLSGVGHKGNEFLVLGGKNSSGFDLGYLGLRSRCLVDHSKKGA